MIRESNQLFFFEYCLQHKYLLSNKIKKNVDKLMFHNGKNRF